MLYLQKIATLATFLACALSASADVPPNCGPNKQAKNALECECVKGTAPQSDGTCKSVLSGSGGTSTPSVLPATGPTLPTEPPVSPSCGAGMCGPSVFNVINGLNDNDPFGSDELNGLQQELLLQKSIKLRESSRSDSNLSNMQGH